MRLLIFTLSKFTTKKTLITYKLITVDKKRKAAPTGATSLLQFQQFTLAVDSIGASLLQNDIAAATVKLLFASLLAATSLLGRSGLP